MLSSTSTLPNYDLCFIKCMKNDKYEKSGKENMSSWACSDTLRCHKTLETFNAKWYLVQATQQTQQTVETLYNSKECKTF